MLPALQLTANIIRPVLKWSGCAYVRLLRGKKPPTCTNSIIAISSKQFFVSCRLLLGDWYELRCFAVAVDNLQVEVPGSAVYSEAGEYRQSVCAQIALDNFRIAWIHRLPGTKELYRYCTTPCPEQIHSLLGIKISPKSRKFLSYRFHKR